MKEKKQKQSNYNISMERDYEIFHYLDDENFYVPLHSHNFYEFYFLLDGSCSYQIENSIFAIKPGDVLLFSINQPHRPLFSGTHGAYERIVLRISENTLRMLSDKKSDLNTCFNRENSRKAYRFPLETQNKIRVILSQLINEQDHGQDFFGSELLYKAYLTELLVLFQRNCGKKQKSPVPDSAKQLQLIETVDHYIEEHFDQHISVEELANYVYLSKYYFMRHFKEITGLSVYQYITQKRLIVAANLIKEGTPITSSYLLCGFGDYTNFLRAFKKQFGCSPKTYANASNLPESE